MCYDANGEWRLDGTSWHVMMPMLCVWLDGTSWHVMMPFAASVSPSDTLARYVMARVSPGDPKHHVAA